MDLALEALIIKTVEAVYLDEKHDWYAGFVSITAKDLINHSLQQYRKITASNSMVNKRTMDEPMDPLFQLMSILKELTNVYSLLWMMKLHIHPSKFCKWHTMQSAH